jgi:hypothetical protein
VLLGLGSYRLDSSECKEGSRREHEGCHSDHVSVQGKKNGSGGLFERLAILFDGKTPLPGGNNLRVHT